MKVALLQGDIDWNQPQKNVQRYSRLIDQAQAEGAALIVLPEMFTTGFSLLCGEEAQLASKLGSALLEAKAQKHTTYICGSLPLLHPDDTRPTNALRLFGPHGHIADYSKVHLFSGLGEDKQYRCGNASLRLPIFDFRVAFAVCYDLRFAQYFSALAPHSDLFVISANWPEVRQTHWETLLAARAIENQAYVIGVNRVGTDGNALNYAGGSMIVSPRGEILAKGSNQELILYADLDIEEVRKLRSSFPVFKDRKAEIYATIENG
jgi:predicted amidohydrolase